MFSSIKPNTVNGGEPNDTAENNKWNKVDCTATLDLHTEVFGRTYVDSIYENVQKNQT